MQCVVQVPLVTVSDCFTAGRSNAVPDKTMASVRFLHTADVHLDTSFAGSVFPSRLGDRKREAIRSTFRRLLDAARAEAVDLVLIAGDLFEHDRVTPDTIELLKQQFEGLGAIPVLISPGNHDPYTHGSPYHDEPWPENVHLFREEEFRSIEFPDLGVRVTGYGFNRANLAERTFARLPALSPDLVNIVLAHGSDVTHAPAGKMQYAPFAIAELAGKNVRYCALGHYHQQHRLPNAIDQTEAWYAGIPEGRGWDEEGSCGYLLGTIEGEQVQVQSRVSGQYPLRTLVIDCDGFSTREQIVEALSAERGRHFDSNTILRIRLTGTVDPRMDLSIPELTERLSGEVLHAVWDDQTQPALDFQTIACEKTLRGRFVRTLNDRLATADGSQRAVLERARLYGLQALLGREVRLK
jgi:DNA repair protein SbcD/Mre11